MSALALAMKKSGWKVTGSDVGIYPPISDYLKNNGVDYYTGWHPDRALRSFSEGGTDGSIVVVGNVAGSTNPEWLYTQEHKLEYKSYPELIAKYFVKKNSIVCAGTYGKTTTAALLSWILTQAGLEPSYMFGGLSIDESFGSASLGKPHKGIPRLVARLLARDDSGESWSVLEGDEYKSARWDERPKFAHYSPTHLLLTAIEWDHADVYPTGESYFKAFERLVKSVLDDGLVVMNEKTYDIRHKTKNCVTYGKNNFVDYKYSDVKITKDGIEFDVTHNSSILHLTSYVLGDYMAENITGAFAMACEIGIKPEVIIKAIAEFKGLKRRLEKRFGGDVTVFDDIAHSPAKAESALKSLRAVYSDRIIAVFEPNTGNRQAEAIPSYNNKFNAADLVIIPQLTHIKHDPKKSPPIEGEELTKIINKTHSNVKYIGDDEMLIEFLVKNSNAGDVIVFLGSHGFRGMIERLVVSFRPRP